jgi:hypothetical protein
MNWVYKIHAVTGDIVASRNLHIPFLVSDLDGCNDISFCIGSTVCFFNLKSFRSEVYYYYSDI